jgi:hypothetical protein
VWVIFSLFVWLVANGWSWFVLREKYCWLVADGWFILREKYCWLVADKPSEQGAYMPLSVADEPKANCSDPASRVACMHMSIPNNNVKLLIAPRDVMYVSQYVWESCVCI